MVFFLFIYALHCIYASPTVHIESAGSFITFSVSNIDEEYLNILTWGTPFEGIKSNLFEVNQVNQKEKRPYIGMLLRRGLPLPKDYVKVFRHTSLSVTFDISESYFIDKVGTYEVRLNLPTYSGVSQFEIINNLVIVNVTSSHLSKLPNFEHEDQMVGCSASEEEDVTEAVGASLPVVQRAYHCMASETCDSDCVTWFGRYSKSNYGYDRDKVFLAIGNHMQRTPFNSVCYPAGCADNVYAYVYPTDRTFTVYLCNLFFTIPNERIETIIHEMSHFVTLGATQDYAYGRTPCKNLAKSNPNQASHNADNVCYFASDVGKKK